MYGFPLMSLTDFTQLHAWKKATDLAVLIYEVTKKFPTTEQYGVVSQLRRASVSVAYCERIGYINSQEREELINFCTEVHKLINGLITCMNDGVRRKATKP